MSRKPLALIATTLLAVFAAGTAIADKKRSFSSYGRVTHVEPLYKTYTIHEPQKHCEYIRPQRGQRHANINNNRQRRFTSGSYYGQKNSNGRSFIDKNHNRQVRNQNRNFNNRGRQHCVTRNVSREVRRQDGFRVTYFYQGNQSQTRTTYHPGHRIRINVQLQTY